MSRNIKVAAVALALAGGVYLGGAAPAEASNMGFKLERSFDLVRGAGGRVLQSKYWVSFPHFNGLGDVGNAGATTPSKCVGDANGPAAGDGVVDSLDAVCDMWTARQNPTQAGAFVFRYWDSATCAYVTYAANINRLTGAMVLPNPRFTLNPAIGYEVTIGVQGSDTFTPSNDAVIVGSHDPSFTGLPLAYSTTCGARAQRQALINLPYHSMYRISFELLCGLETVDWVDNLPAGSPDGKPDACWEDLDNDQAFDVGEPLTGIYDGDTSVTVATFDAVNDLPINTAAQFVSLTRKVGFPLPAYNLVPGESYMVQMQPGHASVFISPHY